MDTWSEARCWIRDSNRYGCLSHVGAALSLDAPSEGDKVGTTTADVIEDCGPEWTVEMGRIWRVNPGALDR